jgi:hypothetical protein
MSCDKINDILDIGMDANIDGTEWVSITRVTLLNSDKFTITGTSSAGDILVITIDGSTTGTYTLNPLLSKTQCGCTYKQSLSSASGDWYLSVEGKVTLSEVDKTNKKISGIFEFSLLNGTTYKPVTNGAFRNLSYQ